MNRGIAEAETAEAIASGVIAVDVDEDAVPPARAGLRPPPQAAGGQPRLLDLLIVLSRRRRLILRTTFAAAAAGTMVALLLPNRYTATATILPPQPSQSLAASMIGQLGALGPVAAMAQKDLGLKNPNDLYVGMLRSRTTKDALILRFDLLRLYHDRKMSDARRDLEKASDIVVGKEGFIRISVEDKSRVRAPQIANAYVDELRQLTQTLAVTEAGQRRLFFEGQLEQAKDNLADAEQALKETEQKTGLIQLDGQAKAIVDAVVKLRALIAAKNCMPCGCSRPRKILTSGWAKSSSPGCGSSWPGSKSGAQARFRATSRSRPAACRKPACSMSANCAR